MAILVREIWVNTIQEQLREQVNLLQYSVNENQYIQYRRVNRPQAGKDPDVYRDRNDLPLPVGQRKDALLDYGLHNFKSQPMMITNWEKAQIGYDKVASLTSSSSAAVRESIVRNVLVDWVKGLPGTNIVRTGGAASAANKPHATATGTRKLITKDDVQELAKRFDKDNVPEDNRFLALPTDLYYQMLQDADIRDYMKVGKYALLDGKLPTLFNFNIVKGNNMPLFTNAGTPVVKDVDEKNAATAYAASDNAGCIAWHSSLVGHAIEVENMYVKLGDPQLFGDVMSFEANGGGAPMRLDRKGIYALVQEHGS